MIVLFFSSAIIVFSMPIVITNETIRNVLFVSIIYLCFLYYIYYDTVKCSLLLLLATRHLLDKNTWLFPHYYEQLALKIFLRAESSQKKISKREGISIIITTWNNISARELQNKSSRKRQEQQLVDGQEEKQWQRRKVEEEKVRN